MRYFWLYLAALVLLLVVLPWLLVSGETALQQPVALLKVSEGISMEQKTLPAVEFAVSVPLPASVESGALDSLQRTALNEPQIRLWLANEQRVELLPLEEYVALVTAAEMPALFAEAALEAQSIAVRTYSLKRLQQQDKNRDHPLGDLCDQPGHCQAYYSQQTLQQRWQQDYDILWPRVQAAVQNTAGIILSYRGQLIDALYHSTCGGQTEYASEVWGGDMATRPYLVSVACPWDTASLRYSGSVFYTWQELESRLGLEAAAMQVAAQGASLWNVNALTASGRIAKATLLGESFSGTALRSYLGLNSTRFNVVQREDGLVFEVTGYGHGVGLCQYGANGYAQSGATSAQILGHYYSGVTLLPDYGE